jgi:hypothetical protein
MATKTAAPEVPKAVALAQKALAGILSAEERHEVLVAKIDRFGALKAAIGPLEAEAKKLGDELKTVLPAGTHAGTVFEVLITKTTNRVVNNVKLIKKIGERSIKKPWGSKADIDSVTEDGEGSISIRSKAIKNVTLEGVIM